MANIYQGSSFDKVKIKSLLEDAQKAYHALVTGSKAEKVERNGRMVQFTKTNLQSLRLYIQELQASLSVSDGSGRSPARVSF